jgi:putative addiction module component (TIGR02574 family)
MGDLLEAIKKLSVQERLALIQTILQTISDEADYLTDVEISPELEIEISKRELEIKEGKAQTVPWEDVKKKLTERYGI